jgi:hypothetical protein
MSKEILQHTSEQRNVRGKARNVEVAKFGNNSRVSDALFPLCLQQLITYYKFNGPGI